MCSARLWPLLALIPWLAACPIIYSEEPLGMEAAVLDPAKVNGTWLRDGGLAGVRVLDDRRDTLIWWTVRDFSIERSPECEPPPKIPTSCGSLFQQDDGGTCTVRRYVASEGRTFYFYSVREEKDSGAYETPGVALSDHRPVAVFYPVAETKEAHKRLNELIGKGALPGHVDPNGHVVLGALSPDHYRLIVSPESGLFDWTDPQPFIKLPDELDPCKKGRQLNPDAGTKPNGKVDISPDSTR